MTDYVSLKYEIEAYFETESNPLIVLANSAAVLNEYLDDINWVGFYLANNAKEILTLGPFQGKVACTRIEKGKGVCGTAWLTEQVQRVDNVHEFDGHIACDSQSQSEIVLPLMIETSSGVKCIGVLDIDSPSLARFAIEDEKRLTEIAEVICIALSRTKIENLLSILD
ncbi:GAF domain-containing protein [Thorsellia anophelis]|nr:GAF domain-containing protein [Thorsellia anophelis]